MDKIKILIADDVEETREVIKKLLNLDNDYFQVVGEASDGEEVLKLIPRINPDVVLMDINMPVLNGLEATEKITEDYPETIVIIMSVQAESEYLKKAMFYGAKEYIIKPFNYDTLINTIKTTYEKQKERSVKLTGHVEKTRNAKIVTFFSSKGGVGKSVLSLNSAVTLSRLGNKKILLMDMDLLFGDISMMVNKFAEKNILDMIDDNQMDSYENMKSYIYEHNENLHMLFAPQKPEAAEYINKDSIEKIVNILRTHYDIIIVDTGINFSDNTLYVLDISEIILFISTMEIVSLKNSKLGFGVMKSLGYDKEKVKLVINRFNTSFGISKADLESAFKDELLLMIPEDEKTVSISVNKGNPFCESARNDNLKIKKSILAMCEKIDT